MRHASLILCWLLLFFAAAGLSWVTIAVIHPWLRKKVLVNPSARSGHRVPTPQGGGIAVVPSVIAVASVLAFFTATLTTALMVHAAAIALASIALMVVGFLDDRRGVSILGRLGVQTLAVGVVVATLPEEMRLLPIVPIALERTLIVLGGIWFVNIYNFMDGIDSMTVTETASIGLGVSLLALFGFLPAFVGGFGAALIGGMIGFAWWNFPPAKLFLGDAGSLPIGLVVGTMLLHVAFDVAISVAIILALFYLMDATITLVRRLIRGEPFWIAHREHFYQRAGRNGLPTGKVIASIIALNALLISLALVATHYRLDALPKYASLVLAFACVVALLRYFAAARYNR